MLERILVTLFLESQRIRILRHLYKRWEDELNIGSAKALPSVTGSGKLL
jgi:hypothetical protein